MLLKAADEIGDETVLSGKLNAAFSVRLKQALQSI